MNGRRIEVDQDVLDVLMEASVKHALYVSDGSVPRVQMALADHAHDLSPTARRVIAHYIVEPGPMHERDNESWTATLKHLEPRRST